MRSAIQSYRLRGLMSINSLKISFLPSQPQRRRCSIPAPMHYESGNVIQIRSYEPSPQTRKYKTLISPEQFCSRQERAPLVELSENLPPAPDGQLGPPIDLHITAAIRTGAGFHSQVVRADFSAASPMMKDVIAKFYDPFLAETEDDPELDVFHIADDDVVSEVAAYAKLISLQGTVIPRFFGSYSCTLPTGLRNNTRPIRLILLEYVRGPTISSYSRDVILQMSQTARKNIMYKIVEAESRIYASGVRHGDIHPRNVIIGSVCDLEKVENDDKFANPAVNIRFIDFGKADLVSSDIDEENLFSYYRGKLISPILRWNSRDWDFEDAGWIDWDWQKWVEESWGDSKFYEPVTKKDRDLWILPQ